MSVLVAYRVPKADPATIAARDRRLLMIAEATAEASLLCVYECLGDVLGLGRFHAVPDVPEGAEVRLHRRFGGGRPVPLGEGYFGVTLALPDVSTLATGGVVRLQPEQVLNRAVRGVLAALETLGVSAYYPGRDLVTAGRKIIGALTLEIEPSGRALVEMAVAANRSFAEVTSFLDRADPTGVVPADVVLPGHATSIAEETGLRATLDTFADAVVAGFVARLGVACVPAEEPLPPVDPDDEWLLAGRLAPHLDRYGAARTALGSLQARVALGGGRIADLRLTGDFIASAATIARMERSLRDVVPDRSTILHRVNEALAGPTDFLLGVKPLDVIADVVMQACDTAA